MRLYQACTILASVTLGAGPVIAAAPTAAEIRDSVRSYREQHEPAIVAEFARLLAIPNHAADSVNIRKNAEHIASLLRDRQVETRLLELEGAPPVVFGKIDVPGATRTVTFYVHYDGQPTRQSGWTVGPFEPTLRRPDGSTIDLRSLPKRLDPEWRLFARSASDDKAPVIGILTALDALRAAGWRPNINVRFFFEGEEEAGSPHLAALLKKYADGPRDRRSGSSATAPSTRTAGSWSTSACAAPLGRDHRLRPEPRLAQRALRQLGAESHRRCSRTCSTACATRTARILIAGLLRRRARAHRDRAAGRARDAGLRCDRSNASSASRARRMSRASLQAQLLLPALNVRGIAGGNVGDAAANAIAYRSDGVDRLPAGAGPDARKRAPPRRAACRETGLLHRAAAARPGDATRAPEDRAARVG